MNADKKNKSWWSRAIYSPLQELQKNCNLDQITWDFLYFSYWNNIPLPPLPPNNVAFSPKNRGHSDGPTLKRGEGRGK